MTIQKMKMLKKIKFSKILRNIVQVRNDELTFNVTVMTMTVKTRVPKVQFPNIFRERLIYTSMNEGNTRNIPVLRYDATNKAAAN